MVFRKQKLGQRRQALIRFLGVYLVGFCLLNYPCMVFADDAAESQSYPALISQIIDRIEADYNIKFTYREINVDQLTDLKFTFQEAEDKDHQRLYEYMRIFDEEIRKYPKNFFKSRAMKEVFFVKKLFYGEKNAEGLYDYNKKNIFFDFAKQRGGSLSIRHNIHHEIFHVIDTNTFYWKGADWESFNEPGFRYFRKDKIHIDQTKNPANYFAPKRKGFVTYYSMTSVYEDKAEIYACLFVKSQHKLMHRWARKDRYLKQKLDYIKKFVFDYSGGEIDEAYFSNLWPDINQ